MSEKLPAPEWPLYRLEEEEVTDGIGKGIIQVRASAKWNGMLYSGVYALTSKQAVGLQIVREKAVYMLREIIETKQGVTGRDMRRLVADIRHFLRPNAPERYVEAIMNRLMP